jgi:hypothetical protein
MPYLLLAIALVTPADDLAEPLTLVRPLAASTIGVALNAKGDLTGYEWTPEAGDPDVLYQRPFVLRAGEVRYLDPLAGYTAAFVADLTDAGEAVGWVTKPPVPGSGRGERAQPVLWDTQARPHVLPIPDDNVSARITGASGDGRRLAGIAMGPRGGRAIVWERPDAASSEWATVELPQDDEVASHVLALSPDGRRAAATESTRPVLWTRGDDGTWTRRVIGGVSSLTPRAVNDAGTVVGLALTPDGGSHAVVWTEARGEVVRILLPPPYLKAEALAVDGRGRVVGIADGPGGSPIGPHGFLYENARTRILTECGPEFGGATTLNDAGQVAGYVEPVEEPEEPGDPGKAGKTVTGGEPPRD